LLSRITSTLNANPISTQIFLLYQGFVQVIQLWYQQQRDYANRALGKTMPMDLTVSWFELFGITKS
jgi:hypothetical protein